MCTLSIITLRQSGSPGGFRVVMNRDELNDRPEALPPRWRPHGEAAGRVRAISPSDPKGGGTWIAAAEHGLVLCLLNLNPEPAPAPPHNAESRGVIIPRLLRCGTGEGALRDLGSLDLPRFAPFRLVVVEPDATGPDWTGSAGTHLARWDGSDLSIERGLALPACFVSSGLGDSLVTPRLRLFSQVLADDSSPRAQDQFHRHCWPDRAHVSVLMQREDARTVSITTVEVCPRPGRRPAVLMSYAPVPAGAAAAIG